MATKSTKSRRRVLKGRKRPIGLEGSATRALLLDAAERLMLDEGYAAVTTRRLGAYAHINPQLVHYYFPSLDDLFIALLQRRTADHLKTVKETLASDRPFRAFWLMSRDPTDAGITAELNALSRHRKALRAKIRAHAEEVRSLQHAALVRYFKQRGIRPNVDVRALIIMMTSVGVSLVLEDELGVTFGHAQIEAHVEKALAAIEAGRYIPWTNSLQVQTRRRRRKKKQLVTEQKVNPPL